MSLLPAHAVGARLRPASRLRDLLDLTLLVEAGWDPEHATFSPDRQHRLLGYRLCQVAGCERESWSPSGLCGGCLARYEKEGAGRDLAAFCARGPGRTHRSRDRLCLVCCRPGFERPVQTNDLCASCDGLRRRRRQSISAYVEGDEHYPPASPRATIGRCSVSACARLAGHPRSQLCPAHEMAWRAAGSPELSGFGRSASPCAPDQCGRVVLAGLDEELIAEILYGIQAALAEGRQVMPPTLRSVVAHLRRCGATKLCPAHEMARRARRSAPSAPSPLTAPRSRRATSARSTKKTVGTCACSVRAGRSPLSAAALVPAIPVSRRRVPSPSSGCARRPRRGPPRRCAR